MNPPNATPPGLVEIRLAAFPKDRDAIRALLSEYRAYLGTFMAEQRLCCDLPATELDHLPGDHSAPRGAFSLALVDGTPAGCAALRPISVAAMEQAAELRRMWVRPEFRRLSLGRRLLLALIDHAASGGYTAIYLDTFPAHMPAAQPLYRSLGFLPVPQYGGHSAEGMAYMRLDLRPAR